MKPSELLRKKGWCQYAYAEDINGHRSNIHSPYATKFCITGAIQFCYEDIDPLKMLGLFEKLTEIVKESLPCWNDRQQRQAIEVIALLESIGE